MAMSRQCLLLPLSHTVCLVLSVLPTVCLVPSCVKLEYHNGCVSSVSHDGCMVRESAGHICFAACAASHKAFLFGGTIAGWRIPKVQHQHLIVLLSCSLASSLPSLLHCLSCRAHCVSLTVSIAVSLSVALTASLRYNTNTKSYAMLLSDAHRETPAAFSHFTHHESNGQVLVCDIQGVGDRYTDPQIIDARGCHDYVIDLGKSAIRDWFSSHRWRADCSCYVLIVLATVSCQL